MRLNIAIKGIQPIVRSLGGDFLDRALRPGFENSSVVVEGAARGKVHTVTRKLQGSLGHELIGQGGSLEAHIGPQPGLGQPRGYSASDTSRWKKPRKGRNVGDPAVPYRGKKRTYPPYAPFEEARHPFLEPALDDNIGRIEDLIQRSIDEAFR